MTQRSISIILQHTFNAKFARRCSVFVVFIAGKQTYKLPAICRNHIQEQIFSLLSADARQDPDFAICDI